LKKAIKKIKVMKVIKKAGQNPASITLF